MTTTSRTLKHLSRLVAALGAIAFVGVAQVAADPTSWWGVSSGIVIESGVIKWRGYFINTQMNGYLDACLSSTTGLSKCPGGIDVNIIWGEESAGHCVQNMEASIYVSGSNEYGSGDSYSSTSYYCPAGGDNGGENELPGYCSTLRANQVVLACSGYDPYGW